MLAKREERVHDGAGLARPAALIPVKPHALNAELVGRQADVPALMGLVAIEAPAWDPAARLEPALPGGLDACAFVAGDGLERHDDPLAGDEKLVLAEAQHEPAMGGGVLRVLRRPRIDEGDVEPVRAEDVALRRCIDLALEVDGRAEAGDVVRTLTLQNERREAREQAIGFAERVLVRILNGFDRERTESDRVERAEGVKGVGGRFRRGGCDRAPRESCRSRSRPGP